MRCRDDPGRARTQRTFARGGHGMAWSLGTSHSWAMFRLSPRPEKRVTPACAERPLAPEPEAAGR